MPERRLRIVLRQLLLAAGAVVLAAPPACDDPCPERPWAAPESLALDGSATIRGVIRDQTLAYNVGVGDGGVIVELSGRRRVLRPVKADLRSVAYVGNKTVAVGTNGTMVALASGTDDIAVIDPGTTADLAQIVTIERRSGPESYVVGDGVVLRYDMSADAWSEVPAPKGGWGELRAMAGFEGGLVVVGRGGLAWALDDSQGEGWRREGTGTEVDLTAISTRGLIAGGAGGVLIQRTGPTRWRRVDGGTIAGDVVDVTGGVVLTAQGRIYAESVDGTGWTLVAEVGAGPHAPIGEDGGGDPYDPEVPEVKLIAALGEPGTHRKIVNRCTYNQAQGCT